MHIRISVCACVYMHVLYIHICINMKELWKIQPLSVVCTWGPQKRKERGNGRARLSIIWGHYVCEQAGHDSFFSVGWCVFQSDMTHSSVWHDSFLVWHDSFLKVSWLILQCDMTHPSEWHNSFVSVTNPFLPYDLTHSSVWHDSFFSVTLLTTLEVCTHSLTPQLSFPISQLPRACHVTCNWHVSHDMCVTIHMSTCNWYASHDISTFIRVSLVIHISFISHFSHFTCLSFHATLCAFLRDMTR